MKSKFAHGALSIPAAIIIAGAVVAIALIWVNRPPSSGTAGGSATDERLPSAAGAAGMAPVTAADHILGDPNAPVKLVEYSDPSCPYCKTFNPTMESLMAQYGPSGKLAWVYRQFPLDKPDQNGSILHPNAGRQAIAFECAGFLGGNKGFFDYEKKWYEVFPEDGADRPHAEDDAQIAAVAKSAGLDPKAFASCLISARFGQKLADSFDDGLNAGVTGTPYLILVSPSGKLFSFPGGESYVALKSAIDTLLASIPATPSGASSAATSSSAR